MICICPEINDHYVHIFCCNNENILLKLKLILNIFLKKMIEYDIQKNKKFSFDKKKK